jgi:hypothetical protein
MHSFGPETRPGPGPTAWGAEPLAPDTTRDGGTAPLEAPRREREPERHRVATAPMGVTAPLAPVARVRAPRLTYDVYTPDDTLRGARALTEADAARGVRQRHNRIGLAALAFGLTLTTALAALGSCDDGATGRVETTSARAAVSTTVPTIATTATAAAPAEVIPPITFSPPLSPPPPRRRAPKR